LVADRSIHRDQRSTWNYSTGRYRKFATGTLQSAITGALAGFSVAGFRR
jgi:hypothetical protein